MSTYTYNPSDINGRTVSRARFELGDIVVSGGESTCMLSDEEIEAVIQDAKKWKTALYRLADAVCNRLSFETDWNDDGAHFSLSQRAERWQRIRDQFKKDSTASCQIPTSGAVSDSIANPADRGHYFHAGMMDSPYVQPPMPGGDNV